MVSELFITGTAQARYGELASRAAAQGAEVHPVSGEVMAELAQTVTPQGVLAVCRFIDVPLSAVRSRALRLVVILANVRDPGNAGTVLRTADAAGAGAVLFAGSSVDPYNSKCVRASAGSLFHLPVVTGTPVPEAVQALRVAGLRVLAADGGARRTLDDLHADGTLSDGTGWLFGNEAWGLPGRGPRAGRRHRRGAHLRPRGEPELGRRGRGLPVLLGPGARPACCAQPGGRNPGRAVTGCEQLPRGAAAAPCAGARV